MNLVKHTKALGDTQEQTKATCQTLKKEMNEPENKNFRKDYCNNLRGGSPTPFPNADNVMAQIMDLESYWGYNYNTLYQFINEALDDIVTGFTKELNKNRFILMNLVKHTKAMGDTQEQMEATCQTLKKEMNEPENEHFRNDYCKTLP